MSSYLHTTYRRGDCQSLVDDLNSFNQEALKNTLEQGRDKFFSVDVFKKFFLLGDKVAQDLVDFVDKFIKDTAPGKFGLQLESILNDSIASEINGDSDEPCITSYEPFRQGKGKLQTITGLLRYFCDLHKSKQYAANPEAIPTSQFSIGGTSFKTAKIGLVGLHTPGVISDASLDRGEVRQPQTNSIVAAIFDGTTQTINENDKVRLKTSSAQFGKRQIVMRQAGYEAARSLKRAFELMPINFLDQSFIKPEGLNGHLDSEVVNQTRKKLEEQLFKSVNDIAHNISFKPGSYGRGKSFFENLYNQYSNSKNINLDLRSVINTDYRALFHVLSESGEAASLLRRKFIALLPIVLGHRIATGIFTTNYRNQKCLDKVPGGSVAAYVIDLGQGKVGLVSIGDSKIFAVKKDKEIIALNNQEARSSLQYVYRPDKKEPKFIAIPDSSLVSYAELDKQDMETIVLVSDGVSVNLSDLKNIASRKNPQEIASRLLSYSNEFDTDIDMQGKLPEGFDDRTFQVIKYQEAAVAVTTQSSCKDPGE